MATLTRFHTKSEAIEALVIRPILASPTIGDEHGARDAYDIDAIAESVIGYRPPVASHNGFSLGHGWYESVVSTADFWQIVEDNSR